MTSWADTAVAHQLLGRIVYFHALLIEPAIAGRDLAGTGSECCNHDGRYPRRRPADELQPCAPWPVLTDVAATMPACYRPCPASGGCCCCATCQVTAAGAAIAAGWAGIESSAYRRPLGPALTQACAHAAAARIGQVFSDRQQGACRALACHVIASRDCLVPVTADALPLTGELLALWGHSAGSGQPVVSWLNHCTSLDDIRQVLHARRAGS